MPILLLPGSHVTNREQPTNQWHNYNDHRNICTMHADRNKNVSLWNHMSSWCDKSYEEKHSLFLSPTAKPSPKPPPLVYTAWNTSAQLRLQYWSAVSPKTLYSAMASTTPLYIVRIIYRARHLCNIEKVQVETEMHCNMQVSTSL